MLLLFVRSAIRGICCYAIFLSDIVFDTFNESYHLF
ncbi:hypothetical protein ALC57_11413 [Trachymyrmex cornetzi]|uniref:Uncharacterized protein n=1 Tax=Trachymyrmex cornetzi TaxID=471704 RepID=A0A151J2L0_9HYME|nr:hypothetical protein ALC57_11413 [Trachymyrmex cornetzi]